MSAIERIPITSDGGVVCEVFVGAGIADSAAVVLPERLERKTVAIVTQPGARHVADRLMAAVGAAGYESAVRCLPDRDAAKTLSVAEETYLWLNSLDMTRGDTVVAVGGGAVTDLGGFVAATYLRGIEAVHLPTTLLGAVDAAIGGKSAVNVGGKNLAGVFRHPARVVIDTAVLAELPRELLVEGGAEALKAGLIADPGLVDLYRRYGLKAPLADVVTRAVRVKAAVVSDDFTEQGRRAILNYGHTVGHALEYVTGMSHGGAIGIGMVAAGAAAATVCGFTRAEEQAQLVESLGLPTRAPEVDGDAVMQALMRDKKRDASGLRMVLLEDFGRPIVTAVGRETVLAALDAVGVGRRG